ncbi:hypothetical protein N5B55_04870 [Ralstonia pickettii]|uniref:hypothetical protein n=1 Tax=Ralstonia pickettii TaxID=329 RepID=UPI002714A47B|nr:hypothetical protein [Ralstonia pickettii]WKZ86286.1 hypothetical protein N5B55_04870 [Ralstonia pickettii]
MTTIDDAARLEHLLATASIQVEGPDGMGYESVTIQTVIVLKDARLYRKRSQDAQVRAAIDHQIAERK